MADVNGVALGPRNEVKEELGIEGKELEELFEVRPAACRHQMPRTPQHASFHVFLRSRLRGVLASLGVNLSCLGLISSRLFVVWGGQPRSARSRPVLSLLTEPAFDCQVVWLASTNRVVLRVFRVRLSSALFSQS
eukprot:244450-Rhodomonas_salina.4